MNKPVFQVLGTLLLLAAAIGGTWTYAQRTARAGLVDETLRPVASLLKENAGILQSLRSAGYPAADPAILEAYLQRIRKEGVAGNFDAKRKIDQLVNNNTVIVALLTRYAPHAQTADFNAAADKFRDYAISIRDRWQSLFEIFMSGGNLPASGPAFPDEIVNAVAQESEP